jgi:aminoglycoside phosphotransferase (APT) family kinase protein
MRGDAPGPEFDPARLEAFLRDSLGASGSLRLERISGGQSNPTFFVTCGERRMVLRKQPPGTLLPSAHAVDREYRVISALAGTGVPVAPAILFCDDRSVVGTPFYLMERLEGRVFHDCTLPGIPPAERRAMYVSMAEALAALHNVEPAACGLSDYGRAGNYFARQIRRWTQQWEMSRTRDDDAIDRLVAWLPLNIPQDDLNAVVHGDYRIGNLMFHAVEPRVVAILDWELSTLGHPLADLAHCSIAWHSRPDEYGGMLGLDLAALGIPEVGEFEEAYRRVARHGAPLTAFHMAFAFFRWAVIFEGIAARAKAGTAAAANAAEVGRLAEVFAKRAVTFI